LQTVDFQTAIPLRPTLLGIIPCAIGETRSRPTSANLAPLGGQDGQTTLRAKFVHAAAEKK
jgi:hypothetical protein